MNQFKTNQPNAAKLVSSLRNTGYDSYAAIEDIIDNSIDAQARNINVTVTHQKQDIKVIIADDGCGMDEATLDEALKLGSVTDKNEVSDLGKFGMGLCTASISMAKKVEVITREKNSVYFYSSQDLDDVIERNEFVKILQEASQEEINLWKQFERDSGTTIILSKIDRLSDTNISQFSAKLSKDISRIYRKFIDTGICFFVNGQEIEATDPLMLSNPDTKIYSDEIYDLPIIKNNKKETVRVKIAILPEVNAELEKEMKMNVSSQGFYILRNNREISWGQTLSVFNKHNDFNRLRMELSFSATLDNEMKVKFSKDGVSPNQVITDFLKQEIGGQISSIRKTVLKNNKSDKESIVDHTGAENVIAQRAKLLITPRVEIEKRATKKNTADYDFSEEKTRGKNRENFKNVKSSPKGLEARFESAAMGVGGTLYETFQEGKVIIIRWNTDHPFYDKVVLANKESKNIVSAIDYLIFALASAELKNINDDNAGLMVNIKSVMSTNLRALMS